MPSAQVKFDNRNKALDRIVYIGDWKKQFGMAHEAAASVSEESDGYR